MHGRFTWYELYTSDTAAAKRFYPPVTGWGVQTWDKSSAGDPYEMWAAGNLPVAGMMTLTPEMKAMGAPPHWLSYVLVDSADATMRRATSMGAKVAFGPMTMGDVGTFAGFFDPQGALIAILQSERPEAGYDGVPSPGKVSWHELLTTDYRAAFNFYSQLFGWTKLEEMDVPGGMKYQMFGTGTGKTAVGGMYNRGGPMANVPPNWMPYVNVTDAKAAALAITRGGGKLLNGPMEVPGGDWVAMAMDPQGAAFAVHQVAPKPAGAKPALKKAAAKPGKAKPARKAKPGSRGKTKGKARAKPGRKSAKKAKKRR